MAPSCQIKNEPSKEGLSLKLTGTLSTNTAEETLLSIDRALPKKGQVSLDLSGIDFLDSHGLAMLIEVRARCAARGLGFALGPCSDAVNKLQKIVNPEKFLAPLPAAHHEETFFEHIGAAAIDMYEDLGNIISFVGECSIMFYEAVKSPAKIRWRAVWTNLEQTGVNALPIMCMVQFLIGVILAVLGKSVLGMYGATAFIPDLVAIAIIQELGPIISGVVLAGRSGAAYAAEIGTMKVSEEVDALKSMGFDPNHFLVLPKIIAAGIAMPCLLIIGDLVAIIGGLITCVLTTDITLPAYVNEAYKAVKLQMFTEGLTKAFFFAILIAGISCMRGMQVRGGAESVGRGTTSAVVSGIFITILMDTLFSILFHPPL